MLMMVGSLTTSRKYSQEVIKMGWNPFDDGDTEKDGVNAHRPKDGKETMGDKYDKVEKTKIKQRDTIKDILSGIN